MKDINGFEKLDLIREIKYEELTKKRKEEKDKEETKESGEKS